MDTAASPAQQSVQRRPVRGGIFGLLLGLSSAIWLVLFAVIPFGEWLQLALVVIIGIAVGIAWARFAPAKSG